MSRVAKDDERSATLVCSRHRVGFIKFTGPTSHSFGCPVCVGLIRAKVQMEIGRLARRAKQA